LNVTAKELASRELNVKSILTIANPLHARTVGNVLMGSRAMSAIAMEPNSGVSVASLIVTTARSLPRSVKMGEDAIKKEDANVKEQASKDLNAPGRPSPANYMTPANKEEPALMQEAIK